MKTVQQCLREADIDEVVYSALMISPPEYWELKAYDIRLADSFVRREKAYRDFIDQFLKLPAIVSTDDVFFAHPSAPHRHPEIQVELIHLSEIKDNRVEAYSWMMSDREEIAGYLVADTEFNRTHMSELLAHIIEETTFLGFTPERFSEQRQELHNTLVKSMEEADRGETHSAEEVFEHLGLSPKERNAEEDDRNSEFLRAEHRLTDLYRECELARIRDQLE